MKLVFEDETVSSRSLELLDHEKSLVGAEAAHCRRLSQSIQSIRKMRIYNIDFSSKRAGLEKKRMHEKIMEKRSST
jgi:hypothetical protein